ncbi:ABC transporter ATP-binding protein [Microbacter sp. GSS18]|nr:ABC transporter ATP-binding protein [Microbacter sp. GSS18]
MSAPRLRAHTLAAGYPDRRVIDGLDVDVTPGVITAIIGANASGKSTLLSTLARLLPPLAGAVTLDGIDLRGIPRRELARTLGILPQQPTAPDGLTVAELVGRGRYPHRGLLGRWGRDDSRAVDDALAATGMTELADRPIGELSGGQRQRAWIAMALAQDPRILLLDEPTTFLDLSHQLDVLDLLVRLNRDRGTTVVVVLHDLNLAARYADNLIVMSDGGILAHGAPRDVLTADVVASAFGLEALVIPDPLTHTPLVIPVPGGSRTAADGE